jgi:phosphatidylserine/phosphatidylglycerophosphate/cardiolipin synthase-like enzyme
MSGPVTRAITAALVGATVAVCAAALAPSAAAATSKYTLVTEPADNYQRIYQLIDSATSTIDMTMYELVDTTAEAHLVAAAKRGVDVRVVLDTNLEKSNNEAAYTVLDANGVHAVWAPTTYSATHQKTIIVDGTTAAIMTGNLTTRYYATSRDFAVLDTNKIDIAAIEKVFDADYAGTAITPTDGDNLLWSPTDSEPQLLALINSATRSLDVENEEMSSSPIVTALANAADRGVTVHVTMVRDSGYYSEFDKLVSAGAQVHLYPDSATGFYVHAKVVVADAALSSHDAYQGSINFSTASLTRNRELGLITTDTAVDAGLAATLAGDFAGGTAYTG